MRKDLLIEIGAEELPPKALKTLSDAFAQGIHDGLAKAGLESGVIDAYATPRRLAVLVHDLPVTQPERCQERRGPALSTAYDKDGKPTPAATGFARSCGVEIAALQTLETDKGAWLTHISTEPGAPTAELIPTLVQTALDQLPIPKRMRWADRDDEFVRPVHWLVLLHGTEVIPATLFGVEAGRTTRGHRFHHPQTITIAEPSLYAGLLETPGKIIADFDTRRERIRTQAEAVARQVDGRVVMDPALLDEVTSLVEWPVALLGNFERNFLNVPAEALISTMQGHQKYFPVVDRTGRLMPHFITIANLESADPAQIQAGNERVIRPRFSDAEFFWLHDRQQPLAERQAALKGVVFQQRLGTLHDKCERLALLARLIAERSDGNPDWAERAARLCKCDLLTQMVQEFPELQGIMGRHYAGHDGEVHEIAVALDEHYRPRFAGDVLPQTLTGQAVALADRLEHPARHFRHWSGAVRSQGSLRSATRCSGRVAHPDRGAVEPGSGRTAGAGRRPFRASAQSPPLRSLGVRFHHGAAARLLSGTGATRGCYRRRTELSPYPSPGCGPSDSCGHRLSSTARSGQSGGRQ